MNNINITNVLLISIVLGLIISPLMMVDIDFTINEPIKKPLTEEKVEEFYEKNSKYKIYREVVWGDNSHY